jgi:hypothetical protein
MHAPVSRTKDTVVSTMQYENMASNGLPMPRVKLWKARPSIRANTGSNGINRRPASALSYIFIRSPRSSLILSFRSQVLQCSHSAITNAFVKHK